MACLRDELLIVDGEEFVHFCDEHAFTRRRIHIDTVSRFRNRIEMDAVWKEMDAY